MGQQKSLEMHPRFLALQERARAKGATLTISGDVILLQKQDEDADGISSVTAYQIPLSHVRAGYNGVLDATEAMVDSKPF